VNLAGRRQHVELKTLMQALMLTKHDRMEFVNGREEAMCFACTGMGKPHVTCTAESETLRIIIYCLIKNGVQLGEEPIERAAALADIRDAGCNVQPRLFTVGESDDYGD